VNAEILSVGSELVAGRIADTNAAYLSENLLRLGIRVSRHTALGDDLEAVRQVLLDIADRADVAVVTGGIGPTPDDITRQAFAEAARVELTESPEAAEALRARFALWGREPSPSNLIQAHIPQGARLIANPNGTAEGFAIQLKSCLFFCLPGVPFEMKAMCERDVFPELARRSGQSAAVRLLQVFGLGESVVGERLHNLMRRGRSPDVATQVSGGIITVRITATGADLARLTERVEADAAVVRERLAENIYAEGGLSLAEAVARLLEKRNKTIAIAESCTGGEIAARLTDVPGISRCFLQGVVAYSNEAKVRRFGVPEDVIVRHGAVSAETALAMAEGMRRTSGADIALSTTGIAGPSGGTQDKPVGLVYTALSATDARVVREHRLGGDRAAVRNRAARHALNLARLYLEGKLNDE